MELPSSCSVSLLNQYFYGFEFPVWSSFCSSGDLILPIFASPCRFTERSIAQPPDEVDYWRGHQHQRHAKQRPIEGLWQDVPQRVNSSICNPYRIRHENIQRERGPQKIHRPDLPFQAVTRPLDSPTA